jgi:hypothetical protein
MGKGLGHVGRAIEAALIAEPDNAFTVDDLCDRAFPGINRIEKKHRLSIIRAAKSVAKRRANLESRRSETLGGTMIFYTADNVMSYGMFRLKADFLNNYRSTDPRCMPSRITIEEQLRARLIEGGKDHDSVVRGGVWWNHVERWKAAQAGDFKKVAKLKKNHRTVNSETLEGFRKAQMIFATRLNVSSHDPVRCNTTTASPPSFQTTLKTFKLLSLCLNTSSTCGLLASYSILILLSA